MGRDQRLFNREQRRALAVRDGGCRWPDCDRPPSWTEAHHLENWSEQGLSNIDQAILLCALHHLLLHNRGWKILLRDDQYWLQPAVEIDPAQTLIALPSKNPLMLPAPPQQPAAIPRAAGQVKGGGARAGDLLRQPQHSIDGLDQRHGDDPRPGHPHDDYRN
ncbi:hypothetical protein [Cryobacterium sp. TMT1-3]|uniref:hypothetical protein n=1 Tax=Cryobacterium sp. TMT1-3 TaxID=1259237 RepID=UPI001F54697F